MAAKDDNSNDVSGDCGRLYLAALKGDWKSIEGMTNIQRSISRNEETTLHVAAAANQEDFVKKLLTWMASNNYSLTAENDVGNTALTYAAAAGNVNIAEMMLEKNSELPNLGREVKPLSMAASLGHSQMVELLYRKTRIDSLSTSEQIDIFINCVRKDLYEVALQMLDKNSNLTTATNSDGETALHVLANKPSAFVNESQLGVLRRHINIPWLKSKQENSKHSQVNELLKKCLQGYRGDVENSNETSVISYVLFEAAEVGNIEFLVKLICFNFDLLWKRIDRKSIFHIAVEKRHESIFKLLNEIGSIGDLIVGRPFEDSSNILHLAARLAPQDKLNAISGAALQMQLELLWFKFQPQHLLLKAS
ncbi:ankycorbin-like isoform X2 [Quercus lobata]|uniref:ankycorbin-like isoform X2 n=1 Tax=Quercus lobata TaxID=97700 RepID=UPI001247562C|nr:ankycorbin-like isoform X2 [Quercus lobata]